MYSLLQVDDNHRIPAPRIFSRLLAARSWVTFQRAFQGKHWIPKCLGSLFRLYSLLGVGRLTITTLGKGFACCLIISRILWWFWRMQAWKARGVT